MLSALSKMAARNCIFVKCFLKKTQKNTPLQLNFECNGVFWLNLVTLGYNAVLELERSGISYSAILAANDLMALGALKAVREFGYRVPEDVQIIGFDNIEFSQYCEPSLSTMQQPTFDMGAKAVELLTGIIEKRDPVQPERLIPKLLMRKTTR